MISRFPSSRSLLSQFLCAFVLRVNAKQVNSGGVLLESRDRGGRVPPISQILTLLQIQKMSFSLPIFRPGALLLESPGFFFSGPESSVVFAVLHLRLHFQKILKIFALKLLVYEAKLTGLWARNCATIQQPWILKFAFGSEKFLGLSRKGPMASKK